MPSPTQNTMLAIVTTAAHCRLPVSTSSTITSISRAQPLESILVEARGDCRSPRHAGWYQCPGRRERRPRNGPTASGPLAGPRYLSAKAQQASSHPPPKSKKGSRGANTSEHSTIPTTEARHWPAGSVCAGCLVRRGPQCGPPGSPPSLAAAPGPWDRQAKGEPSPCSLVELEGR